jgi:hypothetical protein
MILSSKIKLLAPITLLVVLFAALAACSPQKSTLTLPEEDSILNLAPLPAPGMDALTPQSDGVVIKATPSDGSTGVSLTSSFQFEFSKSMDQVNTETAYALYPGFYNPAANPATFTPLNLTSMCNGKWRVRNPNTAPISFQWDGYGTAERGVGVVAGSSDVFFNSNLGDTVRLFVGTKQQSAKASNSTTCGPRDFTANWSPNSKNLTVQPNTPLEAGKDYTLILNTNPRNSNGQGLLWTPVAVHFYTQAPIGNPNLQNINVQVLPNFAGLQFNKIDGGLSLSLTSSAPVWNLGNNKVFTAQVTAKNTSSEDYSTARAVMSSFVANNVSVVSPSGYTAENNPFVDFGEIKKGESKTVPWKFYVPDGQPFNFKANLIRLTAAQTALTLSSVSPSSFANDLSRSVTVQGTGIRKETVFFIESTRLTVQNWSATSAVVEIPAGFLVGNYGIMAVNPDGTRGVLYPALNIAEGPKPRAADPRDHAFSFADGFVLDYSTKKPIIGATITAKIVSSEGTQTLTVNSVGDGYYLIRGLPPGTHQVKIEATGYETVYRTAVVTDPGNDRTKGATVHIKYAALEPTSTQTTTIGAAGGIHYASDQGENGPFLVIPPGALDSPTPIHFTHLRAAETLPELPRDGYYLAFAKLEPVGLTFKKPATLYLPLQAGIQLPNGTPIKISYFDARENRWVQDITAGVIVTRPNGKQYLEYEINHFTWIGGQWVDDTVEVCVKFASGMPAPSIPTNWGTTDSMGLVKSSVGESQVGRYLDAYILNRPDISKVTVYYSGGGSVKFPCINIGAFPPSPNNPHRIRVQVPDPIEATPGAISPFSVNSNSISSQSIQEKQLLISQAASSQRPFDTTQKELIVSKSTYNFVSTVYSTNIDPSSIRLKIAGDDKTNQLQVTPISSSQVDINLPLTAPLKAGINQLIEITGSNLSGDTSTSALDSDIVADVEVKDVVPIVLPDNWIPNSISTPVYYSENNNNQITVVLRSSDIQNGREKFKIPVRFIDEQGQKIPVRFGNINFTESRLNSQPTSIIGGEAQIEVGIVPTLAPTEYDIDGFSISSMNLPSASQNTTIISSQAVPYIQTRSMFHPNRGKKAKVAPPIDDQPSSQGAIDWLANKTFLAEILDWGNKVGKQEIDIAGRRFLTEEAVSFAWGFIPLVGSGTMVVDEIYNGLIGKGMDPFPTAMSAIAFGSEISIYGSGFGEVEVGLVKIYNLSKGAKGFISKSFGKFLDSFGGGIGCVRRGSVCYQAFKARYSVYWDVFINGGSIAVKDADETAHLAAQVGGCLLRIENRDRLCLTAEEVLTQLSQTIKILEDIQWNGRKWPIGDIVEAIREAAESVGSNPAFAENAYDVIRVIQHVASIPGFEKTMAKFMLNRSQRINFYAEMSYASRVKAAYPSSVKMSELVPTRDPALISEADVVFEADGLKILNDVKNSKNITKPEYKDQARKLCKSAKFLREGGTGSIARFVIYSLDVTIEDANKLANSGVQVVRPDGTRIDTLTDAEFEKKSQGCN